MPRIVAASSSASKPSDGAPSVKPAAAKKPTAHPPYLDLIREAIASDEDHLAVSRQRIANYLWENYGLDSADGRVKAHTKKALDNGIDRNLFVQEKNSYRMTSGQEKAYWAEASPSAQPAPKQKKVAATKQKVVPVKKAAKQTVAGKKTAKK